MFFAPNLVPVGGQVASVHVRHSFEPQTQAAESEVGTESFGVNPATDHWWHKISVWEPASLIFFYLVKVKQYDLQGPTQHLHA